MKQVALAVIRTCTSVDTYGLIEFLIAALTMNIVGTPYGKEGLQHFSDSISTLGNSAAPIRRGECIMYTLCVGGIILVVLMPLFKGIKGWGIDLHSKTSWGKTAKIEQDIEKARDKVLFEGIYPL